MCGSDLSGTAAARSWQTPAALCRLQLLTFSYQKAEKGSVGSLFCFLVEMMGVEPMSENLLTQPSSWTVCFLEFPLRRVNRHTRRQGSPFVHDRLKSEPPMHVHRSDDAQSKAAVLNGGTGDPQVTALPSLRPVGVKLRQP